MNVEKNSLGSAVCVILAAGNSSRMEFHKALLSFSEKESFLQHITKVYSDAGIKTIIAVVNASIKSNLNLSSIYKIVENKNPELGRLHSLKLGLNALDEINFCFVQNVDNPFVTNEILFSLWSHRMEKEFIAPVFKGQGGHPILISRKVMRYIVSLPDKDQILRDVLNKFEKKNVAVEDEKILVNINTKVEYEKLFSEKVLSNMEASV